MTREEQQAVSAWPVPKEHFDVFSSGLHLGPSPKGDFVRWRLITLSLAEKAGTNTPTDRDERS